MALMTSNIPTGKMLTETPLPEVPDIAAKASAEQEEYDKILNKVKDLSGFWSGVSTRAAYHRDLRQIEIDQRTLRESGEIAKDELFIQIHTVDDNINKESAKDYAYLTTSKNAAVFSFKKNNRQDCEPLENWFTKRVRYPGWEIPFYKTNDGAKLHGWDAIEVIADRTKDCKCAAEHVGHENLWFSEDCQDIQKAPVIVRNLRVTEEDLLKIPEINTEAVEKLFEKNHSIGNNRNSTEFIQKCYWRKEYSETIQDPPIEHPEEPIIGNDGITVVGLNPPWTEVPPPRTVNYGKVVMVGWLVHEKGTGTWLRAPKPLFFGRRKPTMDAENKIVGNPQDWPLSYETLYPFVLLPYQVTEDDTIKNTKGRAFMDEAIQEAGSSMLSSIVTWWYRASQMYGSPTNPISAGQLEQLDITLVGGRIYSQPLSFAHMDAPPADSMNTLNGILGINKSETANMNVAAMNREDSRKTAKEMTVAQGESSMQTGMRLTLLSSFLREYYIRCWSIAQSYYQQRYQLWVIGGQIDEDPLNGLPPEYLLAEYDIFSAGDTEVLKREETLNNLKGIYPVLLGRPEFFPLAIVVLKDILKLSFPSGGDKYVAMLDSVAGGDMQQMAGLLGYVTNILGSIVQSHPEVIPDSGGDQQKLGQAIATGMQMAQMYSQGSQPQQGQGQPPMPQSAPMTKAQMDGNQGMMKV